MAGLTALIGQKWVLQGDQPLREGEIRAFSVTWPDFSSVSSGATKTYRNGSSETLSTGTDAVSGNVHTLKTNTVPAGYGGTIVITESKVDIGGESYKVGIRSPILKPGQDA